MTDRDRDQREAELLAQVESLKAKVEAYREGWARSLCEYDLKINRVSMLQGEYHKAVDMEVVKLLEGGNAE